MKKYLRFAFAVIIATAGIYGCTDIFEADLTEDVVVIQAPGDGVTLEDLTVTFWWEPTVGANFYNLQIVSPSFDNVEYIVLDSNTTQTLYAFTLESKEYVLSPTIEQSLWLQIWMFGSWHRS